LASYQHEFGRAAELFEAGMLLRHSLGEHAEETYLLDNAARQARANGEYRHATALLEDALAIHRSLGDRGTLSSGGIGFSLSELGLVYREQGDLMGATRLFEECLKLHRELGDQEGVGIALLSLSDVARDRGDVAALKEYGQASLNILRKLGVEWAIGFMLNNLALGAFMQDDLDNAFTLISESVSRYRHQKADASLAEVLVTLGHVLRARGDKNGASSALTESSQLAARVGPRLVVASSLEGLAAVFNELHQAERCIRALATASALRTRMGTPVRPFEQPLVEHLIAASRRNLGADAFTRLWTQAAAQPWDASLQQLAATSIAQTISSNPDSLGKTPHIQEHESS
jgi:tetratricopeptide (TPR) repeat protein